MKKILNFKLLAAITALLFVVVSCTNDFEDINNNKNAPSSELAAPDMLLTNALESITDRVHEIFLGHEMGSGWVQHMAKVQYTDEDRYVPRVAVVNNTWSSFYAANGMDVALIYKVGEARLNDNYKGVALVLKCYISSVLTDLFGDVPYTEAWRGAAADGGILSPAYDTQESIYTDLIAKLAEANTLLDPDGSEIGGDILFDGDILKWKKFANSLRLRLLLRMSDRAAATVTTAMTAMIADPATYPIMEGNDDNAELIYLGSSPNNNPINENRKTRDDHRVSKTLVDIMWTNNPNADWRVVTYANRPTAGGWWVGLPNGLTSAKAAAYLTNGLKFTSKIGDYFTQPSAPGVLMTYAELQFILAEGVQRGFITGAPNTVQEYYEEGVSASYNQYAADMVPKCIALFGFPAATTVDDLIADYFGYYGAWPAAGTDADKLAKIGEEKWLAMFGQGLQAWFEWRRTGIPTLTPAEDGMNNGKIPVRVFYPSDEASRNPSNLQAAITSQGADDLNTRVWWDTQDNF